MKKMLVRCFLVCRFLTFHSHGRLFRADRECGAWECLLALADDVDHLAVHLAVGGEHLSSALP